MSAVEFQRRIADLTFSAQEHIKELQKEQNDSEAAHEEWESEGETFNAKYEDNKYEAPEPDVIDNSTKIAHIETAIGHLAVDELDGALDE